MNLENKFPIILNNNVFACADARVIIDRNPLTQRIKKRIIYVPNEPMRRLHEKLIICLRNFVGNSPSAFGGVPGRSTITNVLLHRKSRYFYLTDLRHAYQSVRGEILAKILHNEIFKGLVLQEIIHEFLCRYCLASSGGLMVGMPSSPDLFNVYAEVVIDRPIRKLLYGQEIKYSRYLDDLTFSSQFPIQKRIRKAIRAIVCEAGFQVNHRKSVVRDLLKGPVELNGVGIKYSNSGLNLIFIPRYYVRRLRGLLHGLITGKIYPNLPLIQKVEGMMGVFRSITNPDKFWNEGWNMTEQKLFKQYGLFRKIVRGIEDLIIFNTSFIFFK